MAAADLERLAKAKIQLLRKQSWDDLYVFTKYVCGRDLMEESPHKELCDFLMHGVDKSKQLLLGCNPNITTKWIGEREVQKLKKLIMLPRGAFKSTVSSNAFILWLLWHNPNLRIMIDSETLSNAKLYLAGVKDMIENNSLLKMICTNEQGEYLLEPAKKTAGAFNEEQIILEHRTKLGMKEPSVFCAGVDNARTGMHPDVIIMDDLVSERNVGTDMQIAKVKDHYKFSLSLLEPNGLHVVIGTRYHMADLYGDLIDTRTFDNLIRPAVDDNGELYFPARLSQERLQELRQEQGSYIFSCQYMLSPIDDSMATFKREHLQYFEKVEDLVATYITVDLAVSEKESADYTVILCTGIDKNKRLYVMEYMRGHFLPDKSIEGIFQMYEKYQSTCKGVGIETVGFQKAMVYLLKDEMRRRGIHMPIRELKADKDKFRRIRSLQPLFENKEIFLRRGMLELEKELLEFPLSKHDDLPDALAYILQMLRAGNTGKAKQRYTYTPSNRFVNY